MKRIVFCFLVLFFCFTAVRVNADDINLKNETLNPGSFYYPVKRLWEKIESTFQFNIQSKINFNEELLKKRLSELNYIVENKLLSEVQSSSERFAYQAGILSENLMNQENSEKERITKEFEQYSKYLEKLRDKYAANTSFWMLIQHDINTLKILSDKLK